jgi:predicted RNA-binding protein (TIGR00451 family)
MNFIVHPLSKRDLEKIDAYLTLFGFDKKKDTIWSTRIEKHVLVFLANKKTPFLIEKDGLLFPFIEYAKKAEAMCSQMWIDDGAAERVAQGADLMAPGVIRFEERRSNVVLIKALNDDVVAIGLLEEDFKEKVANRHGRVAQNLHSKGDRMYKLIKQI